MEQKEKELDLLDLLSIIGKTIGSFLKNIVKYFLQTIVFSFKKALYFLPFIFIGIGVAFYMTMPSKRKYKADLILQINDGDAFTMRNITNSLSQSFLKVAEPDKNLPEIARMLSIPLQDAADLVDVQAYYLVDLNKNGTVDYVDYNKSFVEDTSHVFMHNQIAIRFESKTPESFNRLNTGFMHYLESNSFLAEQRNIRQAYDQAQVLFYKAEINKLDSLSNLEYFKPEDRMKMTSKDGVMMVSSDKQLFQTQLIDLNNRLRDHEQRLETGKEVVRAVSPLIIDNQATPGRLKTLAIALVVSYLIGLITLLLVFNRRKVETWMEK
jgi:hypothetical protein